LCISISHQPHLSLTQKKSFADYLCEAEAMLLLSRKTVHYYKVM